MPVTTTQLRQTRTFWWERARPAHADISPLRAVIFDADALADARGEPKAGLLDLVMSLFVAGIWVGVVSPGRRAWVQLRVRHLIGDGLVETIVSADDLSTPGDHTELHRLALWELGITAEDALAIAGSSRSLGVAAGLGLPAVVSTDDRAEFADAVAVRTNYDGLSAEGCRRLRTRWLVGQLDGAASRSPR